MALASAQAGNATVVGVENVNVTTKSFSDLTFNATGVSGQGTTITLANQQLGGTANGTITNVASGATVVAGSGVTGTLAATLATDATGVQVNGGNAKTVTVSAITDKGASITTGASTTAVNLDATATANTTDKATVSAVGTVALDNEVTGTQVVENLTLSGNGASVTYNLADAATPANTLKTVALTGEQNVTLNASAVALAGQTVTDTTTEAGTTNVIVSGTYAAGTHNLDKVAADQIQLVSNSAGTTFNLANNANVLVGLAANGTAAVDSTAGGNLVLNSVKAGNTDTAETLNLTVASNQTTSVLNVSGFETVNLTVNDFKTTTGTVTLNNLTASSAANGVVNVSGADNLTLTAATAKKLDATNLTGVLTATATSTLADIVGGSGNDVITVASDTNFKVDGGAGANTLKITGAQDFTDNTVSFTNFGLVEITDTAAVTVQMLSSVVDGKAFTLKGTGTTTDADTLSLTMDSASVNLSNIGVDTATANVTVVTQNVASTVVGSQGADTVDHSGKSAALTYTGTAGNNVVTGGSAADNITAGTGNDTITGGAGNDTINLTAGGANTVIFGESKAANGTDAITGFNGGTGTGADKLDLKAFFAGAGTLNADVFNANPTGATEVAGNSVVRLVDIAGGQDIMTEAGLLAALNGTGEFANLNAAEAASSYAFLTATSADATTFNLYTATSGATSTDFAAVELIGTVGGSNLASLDASNFVFAA